MATIKIKRGTNGVPTLKAGEIAVNTSTDIFYIGEADDQAGTPFAGSGAFCALSGNQSIAGNKTFSANLTVPQTPTADTHAASKKYVDDEVSGAVSGLASAFEYKGTIDASAGTTTALAVAIDTTKYSSATAAIGDYWKVSNGGYLVPTSGGTAFYVNANDSIVYNGSSWDVIDNTNSTISSSQSSISVTGTADAGYNVEVNTVDGGTFS